MSEQGARCLVIFGPPAATVHEKRKKDSLIFAVTSCGRGVHFLGPNLVPTKHSFYASSLSQIIRIIKVFHYSRIYIFTRFFASFSVF